MKIKIIAVGKLKEKYLVAAQAEYVKRLGAYTKVEIVEVKEERVPERLSAAEQAKALTAEAERISRACDDGAVKIALDLAGRQLSSEELAAQLNTYALTGKSTLNFIIGGSLGLAEDFKAGCDLRLAFSPLTFPHQLFRIMLLEQIYRSFKINRGETYHK